LKEQLLISTGTILTKLEELDGAATTTIYKLNINFVVLQACDDQIQITDGVKSCYGVVQQLFDESDNKFKSGSFNVGDQGKILLASIMKSNVNGKFLNY
jgi:hypothetical protein